MVILMQLVTPKENRRHLILLLISGTVQVDFRGESENALFGLKFRFNK